MIYRIVRRAGRFAVVRVLPSGDAAGYDAVADRNDEQIHFAIYGDKPHATAVDLAFSDPQTRKYATFDDAAADLAASSRTLTP